MKFVFVLACFILFVLAPEKGRAQQPAYFMLGEEQFKGLQIYDVIQDRELNYFFATNEGIYVFDFYKYRRLECEGSRSDEVFNFIADQKGTIYCHNLNGQVLRIKKGNCSVFYELEPGENRADLNLAIGNDGHLLVGGKKLVVLDDKGKVVQKHNINSYLGQPYTNSHQQVLYHLGQTHIVMVYDKGRLSKKTIKTTFNLVTTETVFKFISLKNVTYAIDHNHKKLFAFDENTFTLTELEKQAAFDRSAHIRTYKTPGDVLWVAGLSNGTSCIDSSFENYHQFFEDFFISDVYADHEGNILLSTFNKGVIVVPSLKVPGVIAAFKDNPATSVKADAETGVLLGTSKGVLMQYKNNTLAPLSQKGSRPIDGIYTAPGFPLIIYDDDSIRFLDKKTGKIILPHKASLKDVVVVNDSVFYTGTNLGVIRCSKNNMRGWIYKTIDDLRLRIHALDYIKSSGTLYAATANGLMATSNNGSVNPVIYQNQKIYVDELAAYGDTLYAIGKKDMIYKIYGGKVVRTLQLRVNGSQVHASKIIVSGQRMYVKSSSQLYVFSLSGVYKGNTGMQNGFANQRTIDFDVANDFIYVVHTGGFQQISLDSKQKKNVPPSVKISGFFVNDVPMALKKPVSLNSNQRKIKFQVVSPSLRNGGNINFWYKLKGYDNRWSDTGPGFNEITYNALAPGNYTFMVKAENQFVFGKPISFSFSVAKPFYARLWFIVLCIAVFISAVLLLYQWQLNRQRKKAHILNEINTSRLAAIQSQMNPHFIFNSLNAIQDLVLKGDIDNSYTFITRFSDLIRRTLNYSDKDFIDFEQEIKLIELYLSLEKLRFKSSLNYTIDTGNIDDIMIPPMLVQPFIENALLHGLLHREGQKTLHIKFSIEEMLVCTIEDNGVGREKAKEIKLRQGSGHESFSGEAIKKRFEILGHYFESELGFDYEDLTENGIIKGTKVTIKIPVKHRF